jgi:hypothetical protein
MTNRIILAKADKPAQSDIPAGARAADSVRSVPRIRDMVENTRVESMNRIGRIEIRQLFRRIP